MKKICFAASSGGHFEQLLMLRDLMESYDSFIVTERTSYDTGDLGFPVYYVRQLNRREWKFPVHMAGNLVRSVRIYRKERPEVVITTGVLAVLPLCLLVKLGGGKLIYIESFAKIHSPTLTGRFLYRIADRFYVQWEQMRRVYPKAVYKGGIY